MYNNKKFMLIVILFLTATMQHSLNARFDVEGPYMVREAFWGWGATKPFLIAASVLWLATRKWKKGRPTLKARKFDTSKPRIMNAMNALNILLYVTYCGTVFSACLGCSVAGVSAAIVYYGTHC